MGTDRKVRVVHWAGDDSVDCEVRLINNLFLPIPEDGDFMDFVNPESMTVCQAKAEKILTETKMTDRFQFERKGYFAPDKDSKPDKLIFNRTAGLKESSTVVSLAGGANKSRKEEQAKQAAEKERLR